MDVQDDDEMGVQCGGSLLPPKTYNGYPTISKVSLRKISFLWKTHFYSGAPS